MSIKAYPVSFEELHNRLLLDVDNCQVFWIDKKGLVRLIDGTDIYEIVNKTKKNVNINLSLDDKNIIIQRCMEIMHRETSKPIFA